MIVGKAFCKSKDGGFGRSIACRDGKYIYISRISVCFSKNKMLPLPLLKWSDERSNVINWPLDG